MNGYFFLISAERFLWYQRLWLSLCHLCLWPTDVWLKTCWPAAGEATCHTLHEKKPLIPGYTRGGGGAYSKEGA